MARSLRTPALNSPPSADKIGAVLATSAPANGLFAGLPYALGISGGFSSPKATEILRSADLIIAFGAALNHWTTKHGALIDPDAKLIQIDIEPAPSGATARRTSPSSPTPEPRRSS